MFNIIENTDFSELCITSHALIKKEDTDEIIVETTKAEGVKCRVCWKINKTGCQRHPI